MRDGDTDEEPNLTTQDWVNLVAACIAGAFLAFVGLWFVGAPFVYIRILLSDLLVIAGILVGTLVLRWFLLKRNPQRKFPNFEVLDGFIVSGVVIFFVICLAYFSYKDYDVHRWNTVFRLAISAGALGGLIHEISQSGGKFAVPQYQGSINTQNSSIPNPPPAANQDGTGAIYLGSLSGVLLGAVAGVLLLQGPTPPQDAVTFGVQAFVAGLALKGVAEALADTQAKGSTQT